MNLKPVSLVLKAVDAGMIIACAALAWIASPLGSIIVLQAPAALVAAKALSDARFPITIASACGLIFLICAGSYIWRVFTLVGDNGGFERRAAGLLSRATLWYGAAATAWLACALLWIPLAAAAPYSLIVALSLLMGSLCLSAIAFALVHLTMRATELKDDADLTV